MAAILAIVVVALGIAASMRRTTSPRPVTRLELNLPPGVELFTYGGQSIAVSPDGTRVAFIGVRGGARQIYVRALDGLDAVPIRGTEEIVWSYFFSPDGRSIGFVTPDGVLRTVSLADGLATRVASYAEYTGAAWGSDDRIVFPRSGALWRVSASGQGEPEQLMTLDAERKEVLQAWPTVLPGANAILFASKGSNGDARIEALVTATRERRLLVERGNRPQYVPSGHLVFYRDGQLLAAPFDVASLTVGSPKPVIENVPEGGAGTPVSDVSESGALVYAPATATKRLVWVSRQGTEEPLAAEHGLCWNPRRAPGARQIVVQMGGNLSIRDLTRGGGFTRATSVDLTGGAFPVWAPDGRIVFHSATGIRVLSVETGQTSEVIPGTGAPDFPMSVSQDGERLVFLRNNAADTSGDLYVASLRGDPQISPILKTTGFDSNGRLSLDNRWIVYSSNETGRMEVFVAPFPQVDRKLRVSTEGGTQVAWNLNGREIFYRNGTKMMSVAVSTSPALSLGTPRLLFDEPYAFGAGITVPNYDVSPDGQRFVMVKDESGAGRLIVVLNWTEEVTRLVPAQ